MSLKDDGVTPSNGLVLAIHNYLEANQLRDKVQLFAMIRPRGGDFVYSKTEVDQMMIEINQLKRLGALSGFVFGCLNEDSTLDVESCKLLLNECSTYENTFHRAIDKAIDPLVALEQIIELGFKRVITSGQADGALEGVEMIKKLIEINANRIKISPAAGISDSNLEKLIQLLERKTNEYHGSAKVKQASKMQTDTRSVFDYHVSSEQIVSNMVKIGEKYF